MKKYPEEVRNWPLVILSERGKGHSGASFGLLKFGLLSIQPFEFGLSIFFPIAFPPFDTKSYIRQEMRKMFTKNRSLIQIAFNYPL
jgi:hypothetical protein